MIMCVKPVNNDTIIDRVNEYKYRCSLLAVEVTCKVPYSCCGQEQKMKLSWKFDGFKPAHLFFLLSLCLQSQTDGFL